MADPIEVARNMYATLHGCLNNGDCPQDECRCLEDAKTVIRVYHEAGGTVAAPREPTEAREASDG